MPPKLEQKHWSRKQFDISDLKVYKDTKTGDVFIEGYANTKGHPDRYGEIPTTFEALRNYVYELKDYAKNPIMLIDHDNSIDHVAGSFASVKEDEKGLYVKGKFSNSDLPLIKHARTVYLEGHAKAFSIGGYWYFEDKDNPDHLTYAVIIDISLVGIGADQDALATPVEKTLGLLESAKAMLPTLKPEQISEINIKGLNFCNGKGICHMHKEELSNETVQKLQDAVNVIESTVKKLTV